jgi:hypothetical protein
MTRGFRTRLQQRSNASTTGRTRNPICWRYGVGALIGIVLSAGAATAQQSAGSATDTVASVIIEI